MSETNNIASRIRHARGQAKRELAEMHDEIDHEIRYIKRTD